MVRAVARPRVALIAVAAAVAVVVVAGGGAGSAAAEEGRFQDYAAGARSAALGGAYAALSDDATGIFYNPAGLVDVRTARVNVAASLYGLELQGATPIESDLLRRGVTPADLIFVPSSTGFVTGVGDRLPSGAWSHAIAFGTVVPDFTSRFTEQVPVDDNGTRFRSALTDRRLHVGAAYAGRPSPWLRLGVAAHYLLRTIDAEESLVSGDLGVPGAFIDASDRLRSSSHGVRAVLGAKLWLGPRLTLGLSATTPSLSLWRDVTFERVVASSDGVDASLDVARVKRGGFELQSDVPGGARLGVAWSEPSGYTLSVDVSGWLPVSYDAVPPELLEDVAIAQVPIALHVERGPVVNVAVGADVAVSDDVSLAGGLFTNFTGAPELKTDDAGNLRPDSSRLSRVQMIGGSLALGFHGRFSVSRVGVTGSTGLGELVTPSAPSVRVVDGGPPLRASPGTQTLIYVFWSTTVRFGEDSAARDYSL